MSAWTDFLEKVKAQNFGPDDSQVVSSLVHPARGLGKFGEFLQSQVSQAAGMPQNQDEASMYSYGPSQEQQAAAANNLTGMMQTGAMPFAPRSAGGTLGTFVGPKSAGWNPEAAAQATKLLDAGADPVQVWKQHLIGRMPDKSLFSEIDDSVASLNMMNIPENGDNFTTIGKSLNHPRLNNSYDFIKEFPVDYHQGPHEFNQGSLTGGSDGFISVSGQNENAKSTVLHELQHAIQDREGWAKGGSPEQMTLNDETFKRILETAKNTSNDYLLAKENNGIHPDYGTKAGDLHKTMLEWNQKAKDAKELYRLKLTGGEAYRRLTGEAQARATQDRMNLNMEQRRELYPLAGDKLSDIPLKDLINRYDSGIQSSVNKLPDTEFSRAHAAAQKHAALPVEQGGLGLPKDNTAMDRADVMFPTEGYHGTRTDFNEFQPNSWFSDEPSYASNYSKTLMRNEPDNPTQQVMPVRVRIEKPHNVNYFGNESDMNSVLSKKNKGAYVINNVGGGDSRHFVIKDPKNIRSRFAAFDPFKKDSANILASILAGTTLASAMGDKKRNNK